MLGDFARSLELTNGKEWFHFAQTEGLPDDIPVGVESFYKGKGWLSWGDWLGTGTIANRNRTYLKFEEAKKIARTLKCKSVKDWRLISKLGKLPPLIPFKPYDIYKDKGWVSWGDWLGTGTVAPYLIQFRNFHDARKFVRSLKLKNGDEWRVFSKSEKFPSDIPANPLTVYKNKGWKGMGDWLGTGRIACHLRKYRTFNEARKFVGSLNLKSGSEWRAFCKSGKLPADIPAAPRHTYKDKG